MHFISWKVILNKFSYIKFPKNLRGMEKSRLLCGEGGLTETEKQMELFKIIHVLNSKQKKATVKWTFNSRSSTFLPSSALF